MTENASVRGTVMGFASAFALRATADKSLDPQNEQQVTSGQKSGVRQGFETAGKVATSKDDGAGG